jgi:DNA-binding CsgD family transcriptional regulator
LIEQTEAVDEALLRECLRGKPLEEAASAAALDPIETLTDRERQILRLTAEGLTSSEIGDRLSISHRTVEKHRENVQRKLRLDGTVEMARFAFQHGLMEATPQGGKTEKAPQLH